MSGPLVHAPRKSSLVLAAGLAAASLAGCAVSTRPATYGGFRVSYASPPPAVYEYPSVTYGGAPAYLVDGRWYYPSPSGWVVFRSEPSPLTRYRLDYYGGAYSPGGYYYRGYRGYPSARGYPSYRPYGGARQRGYVESAPPARRPQAAPPARRVR